MKKIQSMVMIIFLVIGFAACTEQSTLTQTTVKTTSEPDVVTFTDPVLEAMVRGTIGKPNGDITADEAKAVTRLNLSNELQQYISDDSVIKNVNGLENFTNLESLDLSGQDISDISPLTELTKLTSLSLAGNPVSDITPLAGLTNLKVLILTNCDAKDYSALANLTTLEFLKLDNSTVTDIAPLGSLTNLKKLFLENSPVTDYSPLTKVYPNLEEKDFIIPSTLAELGFFMNEEKNLAKFSNEDLDVIINHAEWSPPPSGWDANSIRLNIELKNGYALKASYMPGLKTYRFGIVKEGTTPIIYTYEITTQNLTFESGDQESAEQAIQSAMEVVDDQDVFQVPMQFFTDNIQKTFKMTADALFALPFEPPTLKSLGFFPDEVNAVCLYEQRGENDYNIEIHRPEWGEKDYDVRFFTPLSDDYRIVITYNFERKIFLVSADDNSGGGASFEFSSNTNNHTDIWCSDKNLSVENYFINAYNDPQITDIYSYSVKLMQQYFIDRFGMTFEELYALPTCE